MPRLPKAQRIQAQIERLEQTKLIIQKKIEVLQQGYAAVEMELTQLKALSST